MKCPKCKDKDLVPTKLDTGLSALGCTHCEGALISLIYYRDWQERNFPLDEPEQLDREVVAEKDTTTAILCPKCAKIMSRFLISGETKNRVDLCASCYEIWLDGGEWELLKSLELAKKMPSVFTDEWQRKIRKQKTADRKYERLQEAVGQEDAQKAKEVKDWLAPHPRKETIVQYLGSE